MKIETTTAKRMTIGTAVVVVCLSSAIAGTVIAAAATSPAMPSTCAKGSVAAKISGKHLCLRAGLACKAAQDRAYRSHGFTCVHGRLRKVAIPAPPPPPANPFTLTSAAFAAAGAIPARYTCDGANISPPVSWTGMPAGTKSLALMLDDQNATGYAGPYTHWITYNIAATATGLGEGQSGEKIGINDAGGQQYLGPCPATDSPHRYVFHLYALSAAAVAFENDAPGRPYFLLQIAGLKLGEADLTGTYAHK